METKNYFSRFKKMRAKHWVIIAGATIATILGLYFSIGMSVSISQGKTLFGDASLVTKETEISGPTNADISVLVLFWVLTALILAFTVYYVFFAKVDNSKPVKKEVVNGKVIVIKEKEEEKDEPTQSSK